MIITSSFSYQTPHQSLVLISDLEPTGSLADIQEPRPCDNLYVIDASS